MSEPAARSDFADFAELFRGRTFLVVGGAGFIGSHLVGELLALGAKVFALDDMSNGKEENLPRNDPSLKLIKGDVREFDFQSLGKLDGVFNEAARALIPSFKDPVTDLMVNAGGTVRLLEYARKNDVKLVHASSGSVYGNPSRIPIAEDHPLNPISPYAVSKLASEYYCSMFHREYGLDVIALRYFNVYGPRQTASEEMGVIPIFVKRSLGREPLKIFGDGKQTRDFLYVSDVVSANLLAYRSARSAGQIVNVGGQGREVSIEELAHIVMGLCGFDGPLVYADAKPGDIRRLVADNTHAGEVIGYQPRFSLEEGLKRYIGYVRDASGRREA
jgi:UDP-glucose 4-epimerase